MKISSPHFQANKAIPAKFTCQGSDVNPELMIEDIPSSAKTLAIIVDDPDAPAKTWVHWVIFNILVSGPKLIIRENSAPGIQGHNDFGNNNYGGPCPPSGTHRYFFKVYALDALLKLKDGITKAQLEEEMKGHVIDQTEVMGTYKKS